MNDLLARSWFLLKANPYLVLPIFAESFFLVLVTGNGGFLALNGLTMVSLFFLHQAVAAGWLYQMKLLWQTPIVRPTWNEFLEGIARYFWVLLSGSSALVFFFLLVLWISSIVANGAVGEPDLQLAERLLELLQSGKTQEMQKVLQQQAQGVTQLANWAQFILIGLTAFLLFLALIFLWPQYCVMYEQTWLHAWRSSRVTLLRHLRWSTLLGLLWFIFTMLIFVGELSGSPVMQLLAYGFNLVGKAYFTLAFCGFVYWAETTSAMAAPPPSPPIE